jgi:hypothetical protein
VRELIAKERAGLCASGKAFEEDVKVIKCHVSMVVKTGQCFLRRVLVGWFFEYPVCGRWHAQGLLHAAILSACICKAVVPYIDW